nr:DUF1007 family protein [Paracoccus salsus]
MRRLCLSLALALSAQAASAHPHVYIDAALGLVYDDAGRLSAVEVGWSYDELYSLLIVEDLGLDPDGDGVLTPEENAALQGFDADWEPGFDGRLYLASDAGPVSLLAPADFTATYRDGRIISRHLRPLATPLAGEEPARFQVYDPEFYVDFNLLAQPRMLGRDDCSARLTEGDPDATREAYRRALEDALDGATDDSEAEMVTVDIGAVGAGEMEVICGTGQGS